MSLKTLELEKLHLTLASVKLKLCVTSNANIWLPSGLLASLDDKESLKALTSGEVWVSRGRGCRIDFQISFNGKPLSRNSQTHVLESLGYHIRDAFPWPQLSLATSLEIPQPNENFGATQTNISLYIKYGTSFVSSKTPPGAWLVDKVDVKAPASVSSVEFERLQINLSFHSIQREPLTTAKRPKPCPQARECPDLMLLDCASDIEDDLQIGTLKKVVDKLSESLSRSIIMCFNKFKSNNSLPYPSQVDEMLQSSPHYAWNYEDIAVSTKGSALNDGQEIQRSGKAFPKEKTDILRAWLDSHSGNPYPTNDEKLELMKRTGLRRSQLNRWFGTARGRKTQSLATQANRDFILFPQPPETVSENVGAERADRLISPYPAEQSLLQNRIQQLEEKSKSRSETHVKTRSLTSQPSLSSNISQIRSSTSKKRPGSGETIQSNEMASAEILHVTSASKLTLLALHLLIGSYSGRKQELQGVQLKQSKPSTPLSLLIPSIFCPQFREVMAHNSKFLPIISNVICSSWVRHVQGAALKKKLIALSRSKVSAYSHDEEEEESVERLGAVVQGRVWAMMQRKSYDDHAVRQLGPKPSDIAGNIGRVVSDEVVEEEDLLGEIGAMEGKDMKEIMKRDLEDFISGEFMDDDEELLFDDLMAGEYGHHDSDDDLLCYFEERERLSFEMETDDMLFGSGRAAGEEVGADEQVWFLEDQSQEDPMLL